MAQMTQPMSDDEVLKRITVDPEIFGGKPIIRGLRIAVEHVLGMLAAGEVVIVHEYLAQGSNVWGRTDQGWIRLLYLNGAGRPIYPTSWEMDTRPPILFP